MPKMPAQSSLFAISFFSPFYYILLVSVVAALNEKSPRFVYDTNESIPSIKVRDTLSEHTSITQGFEDKRHNSEGFALLATHAESLNKNMKNISKNPENLKVLKNKLSEVTESLVNRRSNVSERTLAASTKLLSHNGVNVRGSEALNGYADIKFNDSLEKDISKSTFVTGVSRKRIKKKVRKTVQSNKKQLATKNDGELEDEKHLFKRTKQSAEAAHEAGGNDVKKQKKGRLKVGGETKVDERRREGAFNLDDEFYIDYAIPVSNKTGKNENVNEARNEDNAKKKITVETGEVEKKGRERENEFLMKKSRPNKRRYTYNKIHSESKEKKKKTEKTEKNKNEPRYTSSIKLTDDSILCGRGDKDEGGFTNGNRTADEEDVNEDCVNEDDATRSLNGNVKKNNDKNFVSTKINESREIENNRKNGYRKIFEKYNINKNDGKTDDDARDQAEWNITGTINNVINGSININISNNTNSMTAAKTFSSYASSLPLSSHPSFSFSTLTTILRATVTTATTTTIAISTTISNVTSTATLSTKKTNTTIKSNNININGNKKNNKHINNNNKTSKYTTSYHGMLAKSKTMKNRDSTDHQDVMTTKGSGRTKALALSRSDNCSSLKSISTKSFYFHIDSRMVLHDGCRFDECDVADIGPQKGAIADTDSGLSTARQRFFKHPMKGASNTNNVLPNTEDENNCSVESELNIRIFFKPPCLFNHSNNPSTSNTRASKNFEKSESRKNNLLFSHEILEIFQGKVNLSKRLIIEGVVGQYSLLSLRLNRQELFTLDNG